MLNVEILLSSIQTPSRATAAFSDSPKFRKNKKPAAQWLNQVGKKDFVGSRNVTLRLDKENAQGHRGQYVRLQLYFTDKWILVSEVSFVTSKDAAGNSKAAVPEDDVEVKDEKETVISGSVVPDGSSNADKKALTKDQVMTVVLPEASDNKEDLGDQQNEQDPLVVTSTPSERKDNDDDVRRRNSSTEAKTSQPSTIYVGLVIGVLGVTVLLLLATILVMLRRNKQKVFSKHHQHQQQQLPPPQPNSMLRHLTPMSFVKGPGECATSTTGHLGSMTLASSKLYEDAALLNGAGEDIYHEPSYPRLVLQRSQRQSAFRNSSCGRLCDYDEPLPRQQQPLTPDISSSPTIRLPDKNKFVSTPLFNVSTVSGSPAAMPRDLSGSTLAYNQPHLRLQQQPHLMLQPQPPPPQMPASFSCQPLLSAAASDHCNSTAPRRATTTTAKRPQQERLLKTQAEQQQQEQEEQMMAGNSFYAATDIFKVRSTLRVRLAGSSKI